MQELSIAEQMEIVGGSSIVVGIGLAALCAVMGYRLLTSSVGRLSIPRIITLEFRK